MSKLTNAEVSELIEGIKLLIIKANTDYAIVQSVAKDKGIQPRQAREYLKRAHRELAEAAIPNRQEAITKAIRRYEFIIKECLKAKQYKTAALTQQRLDMLLGTPEAIKIAVEHTGKNGAPLPQQNGFHAILVDAKAIAAQMAEELERDRQERIARNNGG